MTRLVNVGNRNLEVTYLGAGQPTVVLESGLGDDAGTWANAKLQQEIGAFSKVCAYSRAGLGESDPSPEPRTVQDVINDLEAVLADIAVESPVILVGHSIGGLIVNMYAHQHPQQIVGLVFVDASHPNQEGAFRKVFPTALSDAFELHEQETASENWDSLAARQQGETEYMRPGSLGDKPIIILTADTSLLDHKAIEWTRENIWSDYDETIDRAEKGAWKVLQAQYAKLSSNTRHTEVEGSSHYIHHDNPEVVVEAIRQVVESVRTGKPLV